MAIIGSYERHPDLGCEAVVFLDEESDACFQLQRDLPGGPRAGQCCITTGAGAPVYDGVTAWRVVDDIRFEFALTARAARLFGDDLVSFELAADPEVDADTHVEELAGHVERLLGLDRLP